MGSQVNSTRRVIRTSYYVNKDTWPIDEIEHSCFFSCLLRINERNQTCTVKIWKRIFLCYDQRMLFGILQDVLKHMKMS